MKIGLKINLQGRFVLTSLQVRKRVKICYPTWIVLLVGPFEEAALALTWLGTTVEFSTL
jgi:hypothetical protein